MIAVIADDFTGAAEIGGLGLRYGLKTAIRSTIDLTSPPDPATELLVIAAGTRSKDAAAAARDMQKLTSRLLQLHPRLLYKKIDSVLRGHILTELAAQMETMNLQRTLIVPANPAFGRIISKGIYYIDGKPLHETGFGQDPEFAVRSSNVIDILKQNRHGSSQGPGNERKPGNRQGSGNSEGSGGRQGSDKVQRSDNGQGSDLRALPVLIGSPGKPLPARGFVLGEASTDNDLKKWAGRVNKTTLAAGASGFFSALLSQLGFSAGGSGQVPIPWGNNKLFVCGSSYSESKHIVRSMKTNGLPVSLLPSTLADAGADLPELIEQSASELIKLISTHNYAVLSVGLVNGPPTPDAGPAAETARHIRETMALVAARVMRRTSIKELLLEGGATAAAVLNELRLEQLHPEQEIAHGVLRMRAAGNVQLSITVKPGSYRWPPAIESLLK